MGAQQGEPQNVMGRGSVEVGNVLGRDELAMKGYWKKDLKI